MKKTSKTSKTLKIHPLCAAVPAMADADFNNLIADINEHGLIDPITVYQGQVLDGRHRLKACKKLNIEPSFIEYDGDNPRSFVISKNKMRRHLNESQRALWAARLETTTWGGKREQDPNLDLDEVSRYDASKELEVSRASIASAKKVDREADKEVVKAVEQGKVRVSDAANIVHADKEDQREALQRAMDDRDKTLTSGLNSINNERISEQTMPELPAEQYRVVVIDPPWPIDAGYDRPNRLKQSAGPPYPTMSVDEIKAMKLPLADDAFIFLWTIQTWLDESFDVMKAWGVERMFTMIWRKPHGLQVKGRPQSNAEFIQAGRVGKPKFKDLTNFQMAFNAPKQKEHSTKPDEFYQTIKRVTAGPRLDMFSRREIDGFDSWGKEAK